MSLTRILGVVLVAAIAGVAACAQGTADDELGAKAPKKSVDETEPAPPSVKVPGQTTPEEEEEEEAPPPAPDDGGTPDKTDGGTAADSGTTDAGADTGTSTCAKTAPSNACGLAPQCGCAPNETCDITTKSTGAVSCVLAGGGPLASLCTTTSQCAKGLTCAYGACRPYCATAGAACAGAGVGMCTELYDPPGALVPNGTVCTIACDLRSPSSACGSNNCIWDASVKASDCDKAGTKNLYSPCSSYNECAQGLACVNHPAFGFECEKWCRLGQNDCGIYELCEDVYGVDAPTSGGAKLGHCQ